MSKGRQSMRHSKEQIDAIWKDIKAGKYSSAALNNPKIISDDQVEQVICIPVTDSVEPACYTREPGGEWAETPTVGKTHDYR